MIFNDAEIVIYDGIEGGEVFANNGINCFPPAIKNLLKKRGFVEVAEIQKFFYPSFSQFSDPFLLTDMDKASQRVVTAIEKEESITIYGDYDTDGICATVVLLRGLKELGAKCDFYIPSRFDEGYGLNKEALEDLKKNNLSDIIISVDCGISSVEEAIFAKNQNLDLIITDHHIPLKENELPDALAVINPKREGDKSPAKELAGVAVAWKLLRAVYDIMGVKKEPDYLLEFVALGTASDMVNMTGENRAIAKKGYEKIMNSSIAPIKKLLQNACISKEIQTRDILFKIAPYLNATGRMERASLAVDFFMCQDEKELADIFSVIIKMNRQRQETSESVFREAVKMIEKDCMINEKKGIVLYNSAWHEGVLGIVAARITEKYGVPTVILSLENGVYKGSGRTPDHVDIHRLVTRVEKYVIRFGGHCSAIGLTIDKKNIDLFKENFEIACSEIMDTGGTANKKRVIMVDSVVDISEIDMEFYSCLQKFMPWGPGNEKPVFLSKDVEVVREPKIVGDNHLVMTVKGKNHQFDCIGFGLGTKKNEIKNKNKLSLIYKLEENFFRNQRLLQLKLEYVF